MVAQDAVRNGANRQGCEKIMCPAQQGAQVLEFRPAQKQYTLEEAVQVFLKDRKSTMRGIADDTEETYKVRFKVFNVWAKGRGLTHIDEVDADVVDDFFIYLTDERKNARTGEPLSDNTRRDYYLSLRAYFRALHERGAISRNPIAHKKAADFSEPEIVRYTPSDEDMAAVLALFDSNNLYDKTGATNWEEDKKTFLRIRNKAILALMAECGLRAREVCMLEVSGVVWKAGTNTGTVKFIAKGRRKGREKQRIDTHYFAPTAGAALREYLKQRETLGSSASQFFLTYEEGAAMTTTAIRRLFATARKAANLPKLTPHSIRRNAITNVVKRYGLRHGQRFARHRSSTTTERYDTRPEEEVLEEIAGMDRIGSLLRRRR